MKEEETVYSAVRRSGGWVLGCAQWARSVRTQPAAGGEGGPVAGLVSTGAVAAQPCRQAQSR